MHKLIRTHASNRIPREYAYPRNAAKALGFSGSTAVVRQKFAALTRRRLRQLRPTLLAIAMDDYSRQEVVR